MHGGCGCEDCSSRAQAQGSVKSYNFDQSFWQESLDALNVTLHVPPWDCTDVVVLAVLQSLQLLIKGSLLATHSWIVKPVQACNEQMSGDRGPADMGCWTSLNGRTGALQHLPPATLFPLRIPSKDVGEYSPSTLSQHFISLQVLASGFALHDVTSQGRQPAKL